MKLFKLSAIAAALVSATAFAAPNMSANLELDNISLTGKGLTQAGRVEFNVDQQVGTDAFVAGKASFLAKRDGSTGTDDMWVKFGTKAMSLQLGSFEAADLFPLGKDTIVAKADSSLGYQANKLRGRGNGTTGNGNALHGALNFNFGGMGAEIGIIESKDNGAKGIRPVLKGQFGMFSVAAGVEAIKSSAAASSSSSLSCPAGSVITTVAGLITSCTGGVTTTTNVAASSSSYTGMGLTAGFKLAGGDINANFANAKTGGVKSNSFGLNGTFGPAGIGFVQDKSGSAKGTTLYAAYTLPLMGIAGASVTPAISSSKATGTSNVTGLNVRFNYGF